MRRTLKAISAVLLCAMLSSSIAAADYVHSDAIAPGDTFSIDRGEFFQPRTGNYIPGDVDFDTDTFTIYKKTIKTGASLVQEIKIHNRREEVQIIFADKGVSAAPASRPNVVISELSVRAKRTIRDSNREPIVQADSVYKYDGSLSFRVGLDSEDMDMDRDGVSISLEAGDKRYVRWVGSSDGIVDASYGNMATLTGRVYKGEKHLFYYNDSVDENLEDANPDAYISAVNMGNGSFEGRMNIQLLADKDDYIYEYNSNGKLVAASGIKWSEDEYAWVIKSNSAKHYVISDSRLRSVTGTTTGSNNSSSSSSSSSYVDTPSADNPYGNPSTGGGSNVAVAVSALVAIIAVAVVSIIMSTILAVKKQE